MFRSNKYDVYLSTVTLEELEGCSEPKQSQLIDYLGQIAYTLVQITPNVTEIAQQIIEMGILTKKSYDDCQHIGAAITNLKGHKPIEIINPSALLESEE